MTMQRLFRFFFFFFSSRRRHTRLQGDWSSDVCSSDLFTLGRVTRQNVCHPEAPSEMAAYSSSVSCSCMSGMISRATNGKVMKIVASTIPGTAKMMCRLCAMSHGPNHPCAPNISTKTSPEITGDTAKGRSISVIRTFLPRNWNLAMAQDATSPNSRLQGTEIPAVISVSMIAERAAGSVKLAKYACTPLRKASRKTVSSGRKRNRPRNSSVIAISTARSQGGSRRARDAPATAWAAAAIRGPLSQAAAEPPLQEVDREQPYERSHQHDDGDGGSARVVVLLQLGDDEQRGDLRVHRHVSRDEDHRAVFAQRARKRHGETRERGR